MLRAFEPTIALQESGFATMPTNKDRCYLEGRPSIIKISKATGPRAYSSFSTNRAGSGHWKGLHH